MNCVDVPELLFLASAATFSFFVKDFLYDIIRTSILPFFSLITGTNLNQKVFVLRDGSNAPYNNTDNLAVDDPSAIVLSWGKLINALVTFLVTMGTIISVLWIMCFFFKNKELTIK